MRHLYEAICAAGDQHLAIRGEDSTLRVALLAKLDGAVQLAGVSLHLIPSALSCAAEQVKSCAWRQQPLMLLPVHANMPCQALIVFNGFYSMSILHKDM